MLLRDERSDSGSPSAESERRSVSSSRAIFVDVESAGLQTHRPLIQIAAIAIDSNLRDVEVFEAKIRFSERQATARTLRRRHYDRAVWNRAARPASVVAADFAEFLSRHATVELRGNAGKPFVVAQLVAHNAAFDGPFLQAWFERQDRFFPGSYRVLCTMHRAMWFFQEHPGLPPPADFKLGTLCRYFGVPWNPRRAHDALADVRATVGLYRKLAIYQPRTAEIPTPDHESAT